MATQASTLEKTVDEQIIYWTQSNLATTRAFCSSRKMLTETEKKSIFLIFIFLFKRTEMLH